jgi:hypothetical protein
MNGMMVDARVADLLAAPKARWALAWLAAPPAEQVGPEQMSPADSFNAADVHLKRTGLRALRTNPAGLLAEIHTRVEDWRYQRDALIAVGEDLHLRISNADRERVARDLGNAMAEGRLDIAELEKRLSAVYAAKTFADLAWVSMDLPVQVSGPDRLGPADGYARIATALLAAPAARWWHEPLDRDAQTWICHDLGITRGTKLPFSTNYGHHWDATAPAVAVTTSTRLPRLPAVALLADYNCSPDQRPDPARLSAWDVPVNPDARVYEIHSPADWTALVDRYPSHRTDLCLAPHLAQAWRGDDLIWTPDWRGMSQDYDGVHLSVAGWLTATSQILEVPGRGGRTVCEGWAAESTVWFRPVFDVFERLDLGRLEYGYGRPAAGAELDLAVLPSAPPWWRRVLRWTSSRHTRRRR